MLHIDSIHTQTHTTRTHTNDADKRRQTQILERIFTASHVFVYVRACVRVRVRVHSVYVCVCVLDFSGSARAKGVVGKGVVVVEIAKIADCAVSMVQMAVPREQTATLGTRFLLCVFFY